MLQSEVAALSTELREVREARHMLRAVREEAAQAIQAVRCAAGPGAAPPTPGALGRHHCRTLHCTGPPQSS